MLVSEGYRGAISLFPISRDPPEGGTLELAGYCDSPAERSFQFLGIPPKGERGFAVNGVKVEEGVSNF